MLIFTRNPPERFMIGDDVVIAILGVRGNQVRIGIEAPLSVSVQREEIYQRIQAQKRQEAINRAALADAHRMYEAEHGKPFKEETP